MATSIEIRHRLALRRLLFQRIFKSPSATRPFTSNTALASRARPQLPFLSIPVNTNRRVRYFTTENKNWLRHEGRMFVRYNVAFWGSLVCIGGILFLLNQEWLEKNYPTPHEWSMMTRMLARGAKSAARDTSVGGGGKNWGEIIVTCEEIIKRLQDPKIDGAGIRELLNDEPLSIEGLGSAGKDISDKDEEWRRGYYEIMLMLGNALEQTDGWVRDTTRNITCSPKFVVGPSNPKPQPMPVGAPVAPKEEDCVPAYDSAENVYLRILTTKGFTTKQKMDAALSYAFFLDFKKMPVAAERVFDWALSIATESTPATFPPLVEPRTLTINDKSTPPPENILTEDLARGPISIWENVKRIVAAPTYPPPPPDGTQAPWRSPRQLCEEAALHLYIGEILYSSKDTTVTREEGLAWTRDGVDIAEEQLRELDNEPSRARTVCKDCLSTGLKNWSAMVKRLAKEEELERKKREENPPKSTFGGFWSQPKPAETDGRWAAEQAVVYERIKRTNELLVEMAPPPVGLQDLFKA
ncbi:hypothetical protein F5X68DRAFT_268975 [Plectosphaerella plurivora]|uniref:MFS maltose permease n=1 Tax=Plectosphaerella plurivora TaxID=936078 RepID=A0A9P8VCY2_9PEZI|nr:hypothetical protein F5X68DRAFT_268975 [Plectosphaerella plurivora]